jgi:hypothetical protein
MAINSIIERKSKKQNPGITLSHSSIELMEKCQREYFLRYIEKIRVDDTFPWNAFGSMMHLICENYTGSGVQEIQDLVKCFITDQKLKAKYFDYLDDYYKLKIGKATKVIYKWFNGRWKRSVGYESEKQVDVYKIDSIDGVDINLQGKLDGYYELGGDIFITDFKSGKKKKNHSKQLGFYLFLLSLVDKHIIKRKVYGEVVNLALDDILSYEELVEYQEIEEYDIIVAENRVEKALVTLKGNGITLESKDNWKKKPQKLCDWCAYKKSGHCNGRFDKVEEMEE